MAGKGTFAAFRQLTPIQEDFSDNISRQEGNAFRYRQEQRQQDALDRQRQQDDINLATQAAQDISSIQPVITGIRSVDEINYRATDIAQKRIGDIYRKFKSDPKAQADVGLRMQLSNLKAFPKILKSAEGKLTQYAQDLAKGFADGTYSNWDREKLNELEAFFGVTDENGRTTPNYVIDFDDQGNMIAKGITGDGRFFTKSINDIINGFEYSSATPALNAEEYTDNIAKNLGKKTTSTVGGGFITDSQSFSNVEDSLRNTLRSSLGTDQNPSDIAKTFWADEGNMNMDPSQFGQGSIQQIEDFIIDQVRNKYDETEKKRQLSRSGSGSRNDQQQAGASIRLMTDTATGEPLSPLEGPDMQSYAFSIGQPVTFRVGNKEKRFNTIYLDNTGNILFKGEEKEYKNPNTPSSRGNYLPSDSEPAFKPVFAGKLTLEEVNNLAVQLGFNNATELRRHLEGLSPTDITPEEPQQQPVQQDFRSKYNY